MAVGKLYKRRDADLVPTNVKPGVDIFGVEGSYGGLEGVNKFPVGMAYASNDNDNARGVTESSNHIRFYDDGLKVICMGCVVSEIQQGGFIGRMYYYFEITKSNLTVSNYHTLSLPFNYSGGTSGISRMFIQNIGGVDRYCFFCNKGSVFSYGKSVYFDGTGLVEGGSPGTEIGTSDYILHNGSLIEQTDQTYKLTWNFYHPANWVGQTFTATTTDELKAIEIYTRPSSTPTGNIICELYSGAFGSLLATSDPIDSADMLGFPGLGIPSKVIFRFDGISLTPGNTYSFKITGEGANPSGGSFFYVYVGTNVYAGGSFYDNGYIATGRDMTFKIYFGEYTGKLAGSSQYRHVEDSYCCYMATTGFLNFT